MEKLRILHVNSENIKDILSCIKNRNFTYCVEHYFKYDIDLNQKEHLQKQKATYRINAVYYHLYSAGKACI